MTSIAPAPGAGKSARVLLADGWGNVGRGSWTATAANGAHLTVCRVPRPYGIRWLAVVDPPEGLWWKAAARSPELPTRKVAQQWAELQAARHG